MIDEPRIRTKCFELRCLSYPSAELDADEAKREREQEGDPPPAGIKAGVAEKGGEHAAHSHACPYSNRHRRCVPGCSLASPCVGRVLQDEYGGNAEFSSGCEPLSGAHQHQDNRREQTNRGVSGQQRDTCRRASHEEDHANQNCAAAVHVSQPTEEQGAQRPNGKRRAVGNAADNAVASS